MEGKGLLDHLDGFAAYIMLILLYEVYEVGHEPIGSEQRSFTPQRSGCSPGTWENPLLNDLSPQTLLEWHQMLYHAGSAVATMNLNHNALRRFFSYMEQFGASEKARNHAGRLLRALKDSILRGTGSPPGNLRF
jgi:hypothetical protein